MNDRELQRAHKQFGTMLRQGLDNWKNPADNSFQRMLDIYPLQAYLSQVVLSHLQPINLTEAIDNRTIGNRKFRAWYETLTGLVAHELFDDNGQLAPAICKLFPPEELARLEELAASDPAGFEKFKVDFLKGALIGIGIDLNLQLSEAKSGQKNYTEYMGIIKDQWEENHIGKLDWKRINGHRQRIAAQQKVAVKAKAKAERQAEHAAQAQDVKPSASTIDVAAFRANVKGAAKVDWSAGSAEAHLGELYDAVQKRAAQLEELTLPTALLRELGLPTGSTEPLDWEHENVKAKETLYRQISFIAPENINAAREQYNSTMAARPWWRKVIDFFRPSVRRERAMVRNYPAGLEGAAYQLAQGSLKREGYGLDATKEMLSAQMGLMKALSQQAPTTKAGKTFVHTLHGTAIRKFTELQEKHGKVLAQNEGLSDIGQQRAQANIQAEQQQQHQVHGKSLGGMIVKLEGELRQLQQATQFQKSQTSRRNMPLLEKKKGVLAKEIKRLEWMLEQLLQGMPNRQEIESSHQSAWESQPAFQNKPSVELPETERVVSAWQPAQFYGQELDADNKALYQQAEALAAKVEQARVALTAAQAKQHVSHDVKVKEYQVAELNFKCGEVFETLTKAKGEKPVRALREGLDRSWQVLPALESETRKVATAEAGKGEVAAEQSSGAEDDAIDFDKINERFAALSAEREVAKDTAPEAAIPAADEKSKRVATSSNFRMFLPKFMR